MQLRTSILRERLWFNLKATRSSSLLPSHGFLLANWVFNIKEAVGKKSLVILFLNTVTVIYNHKFTKIHIPAFNLSRLFELHINVLETKICSLCWNLRVNKSLQRRLILLLKVGVNVKILHSWLSLEKFWSNRTAFPEEKKYSNNYLN